MDRLWSKAERDDAGCLVWQAGCFGNGRPAIQVDGKAKNAARVAFELENQVPGERDVLHTCDNPLCIEPDHLYLGDAKQNSEDMYERQEPPQQGSTHHKSELFEDDVVEIRARYEGGATQSELARDYPVNRSSIGKIVRRETWTHLD